MNVDKVGGSQIGEIEPNASENFVDKIPNEKNPPQTADNKFRMPTENANQTPEIYTEALKSD